jgi:hypothetical protein
MSRGKVDSPKSLEPELSRMSKYLDDASAAVGALCEPHLLGGTFALGLTSAPPLESPIVLNANAFTP